MVLEGFNLNTLLQTQTVLDNAKNKSVQPGGTKGQVTQSAKSTSNAEKTGDPIEAKEPNLVYSKDNYKAMLAGYLENDLPIAAASRLNDAGVAKQSAIQKNYEAALDRLNKKYDIENTTERYNQIIKEISAGPPILPKELEHYRSSDRMCASKKIACILIAIVFTIIVYKLYINQYRMI